MLDEMGLQSDLDQLEHVMEHPDLPLWPA